ncbi:MAG: VLRF1 family aeRF1-type release factor [Chloroflexota bacterium]|nr:VLRF1 family aeRF1-type release factor [Chloroflexota bacterium]
MLDLADIKRIQTEMEQPVLSLYLNVDPGYQENQAAQPAWRVWVKNALRDLDRDFDADGKDIWQAIRERAETFLAQYLPESKALVLFMGSNTQETFALPLATENYAAFGEPLVTPLFWKLDEYKRYLIALVDQQEARLLLAHLGDADEEERMEIDLDEYDFREMTISPATSYGKELNQGSNRDAFEDVIDDHRSRFFKSVVDKIAEVAEQHDSKRIILGGAEAAAHAVRNSMPEKMLGQLVDVLPIPLRTPPHAIIERVQPVAYECERTYERQLLDGVIDMAKSGARGALGQKQVMDALAQQRVELLIVPFPVTDDELLQALPGLALQSSSSIEFVHGEAARRLNEEGGIAARLYYAI